MDTNPSRRRRARRQDALNLLSAQPSRQGMLRPVRWGKQSLLESWTAAVFLGQVTQEHSRRCQDHPDRIASVVMVVRRDKAAQVVGGIGLWIIAECIDEMGHVAAIRCQGRVDDPPLTAHPIEKLENEAIGFG